MTTVGILGAGLSGVLMGMQLRRAGFDDFRIYEKNPDVGGTWFRNTYPGLHCDIPSHLYCYSFERNPNWSMTYAGQAEIQAYIRDCAERYDLINHIRFDTCLDVARFDEARGVWTLESSSGERFEHRVLVSATGGLTEPNVTRIPGLDSFEGPLWHSGAWRHDVSLDGARVAVVGSAASAVQVVPEVAKRAGEVFVYSRTPNWVMPRGNAPYSDGDKVALQSEAELRKLWLRQYRESMLWYGAFRRQDAAIGRLRALCLANMHASISDPALRAALTPDYEPGCKRILVSDDYYPTLALDHVHLIPQGVRAVTPWGVVAADGTETAVDIVILCTGYRLGGRADGRAALDVYGRDGETLREALGRRTEVYRGIAVPGFPNYFSVCGVNGTVAYGPLFLSAEVETELIAKWIRRIVEDNLRCVEVRADVTEEYNRRIQGELQTMSWTGDCPNFYRDRQGKVVAFYPGTVGRMRREFRDAEPDHFVLSPF